MTHLWDDTYTGPRWTYGMQHRPIGSFGAVPSGWIIQSTREQANFAHGTVDYPRQLTEQEIAAFELTEVAHP